MFNSFHIAGVEAFNTKDYKTAEYYFAEAIKKNPEVAESYFYLGKCYFFCNKIKDAIITLTKFFGLEKNANTPYALDLLAQCYETNNQDAAALICYIIATKNYRDAASPWHNMGLFYMKYARSNLDKNLEVSAKFFKGAQIFISKALEICEDNPVFLQTVASWYEQYIEVLKRTVEDKNAVQKNIVRNFCYAIEYYQKALLVCQDEELKHIILDNLTECLAQYGHHLYRNEDFENAEKIYLEAINLDPNHLPAINQLGMSLSNLKRYAEARTHFESILKIEKDDHQEMADAWLNIACTYRMEEKWDEAIKALEQAKIYKPENSDIIKEEKILRESLPSTHSISIPQTFFANSAPQSQPHNMEQVKNQPVSQNAFS